jgi:hypothetical protein
MLDVKICLNLREIAFVNFPHTDHSNAWQPLDVFLPKTHENIQLAYVHILLPSDYHLYKRRTHNLDFKTYYELLKKFRCEDRRGMKNFHHTPIKFQHCCGDYLNMTGSLFYPTTIVCYFLLLLCPTLVGSWWSGLW